MPKILKPGYEIDKWNLYLPIELSVTLYRKLLKLGLVDKKSPLIRALIIMFINGDIDETKLLVLVEQETYIKQDGTISFL